MLASALVKTGKITQAVALWENAIQSLPDRDRFDYAASFFRSLGRLSRALAMHRQHLLLNPSSGRAFNSLANAMRAAGKVDEAAALWERAVKTLTEKSRFQGAGDFFKSVQRWERAAVMFAKNLKLNPSSHRAHERLAEALHRTGKTSQAVTLWEKAVLSLTDRYRHERAGNFFRDVGRTDRALAMYRKHFKLNPSRWSCRTLTRALRDAGKVTEAMAVWKKAVLTLGDSSRYNVAGDFMRGVGETDLALAMYREHLALNRSSLAAHRTLTRSLVEVGKVDEAVALWEKAIRSLTDAQRLQRAGEFYDSIARPGRAIVLYRRYLKTSPADVWAYRSLSKALLLAGRTAEAIALWQRAIRKLPTDRCLRSAGDFFRELGRLPLAIRAHRMRLKKKPGDLDAHDRLARVLWQAGKGQQAVALWNKAARTLADNARFRRAGHFFRGIGRWARAAAMYRQHAVLYPGNLGTLGYLTRALVRMGKTKEAVASWDKAVRSLTDGYRFQGAGEFFRQIGRLDRSVEMYRKFLAHSPTSLSAHRELARALRQVGKVKEAEALWDKAVRDLSDKYRHSSAGDFFREIGRWDRAAAMYRMHLKRVQVDHSRSRHLANVLLSAGKVKEATAVWEKAILTPINRYRHNNAGEFFNGIGRPERALTMFRKHLALHPTNYSAYDTLTNQLVRMGRRAEALAVLSAGLKACHEPNIYSRFGRLHHRLGNFERAVKLNRRYLRARPNNVWAHEYLADALVGAGRTAEAEKLWQQWRRSRPWTRLASVADFYLRIGKVDLALPLYRQSLAIRPGSAHAHRDTAAVLWAAGKVSEADGVWARGLKQSREVYRLEFAASYFRHSGRAAQAIQLYQTYLQSRPTDERALESHAEALVMAGRTKDAEAALLQAPPAAGPDFRLGVVGLFLGRTGRLDRAIKLLKKYVAAHPGKAQSHRFLAGAYLAAGKKSQAEAVWKRGLAQCPGSATTAADFYQSIGRYQGAVKLYRRALAGDHQNLALRSQLAHCLAALGKTAEARKHRAAGAALADLSARFAPPSYWTYRGKNHGYASALNSAAWFYLVHDSLKHRHKHALAMARKAVKLAPFSKHFLGTLVVALSRNGLGAEALRLAKRRLAQNPLSAWGHMEKALAHFTLGQHDLARKSMERSRKLHLVPDPDLFRLQKQLSASLQKGGTL